MVVEFEKTESYKAKYPDLGFGLVLLKGCDNGENPEGFDAYKRKLLRKMRKRQTLAEITERIRIYENHMAEFGYPCPLTGHLKRTVNSGFPRYNLLVDSHFLAEMCAGILVAVTDFDRFEGKLTLDLAREGEECKGMGKRDIKTRMGEIVLRDEKDIVCVLCQGADEKTRVQPETENVLFYAYAVPGIDSGYLKDGLEVAAEAVESFGGGKNQGVTIY